ncbi:MAG TPA: hypothetical protein VIM16_05440 [Mucilaginibacter sp.]
MKRIKLLPALTLCIFGMSIMMMNGCQKQSTTPPAPTCSNAGTSVNIGGSNGGTYSATVGIVNNYADLIYFNNTNLNFSILGDSATGDGTIMDVGQQSCLDFSYSGTPTAYTVAYKKGEGYVGKFKDGHIVKFMTISYSGGVALIAYVFQ